MMATEQISKGNQQINCTHCGKEFLRHHSRVKPSNYCSVACSIEHRTVHTNCSWCNTPLVRKHSDSRVNKTGFWYCNWICRNRHTGRLKKARVLEGLAPDIIKYLEASKSMDAHSNRLLRVKAMLKIQSDIRCVNCGCNVIDIIEINHKNGGGSKEFAAGNDKFYRAIVNGERKTDDLDLRCKVCNIVYLVQSRGFHGHTVTFNPI